MSKVPAALIGCGYWGSVLMKYLPKYFDVRIVADSKFDKSRIWSDSNIIAVVVSTPPSTHFEIAKEALLAGKHVLCEKPLTLDVRESCELVELSERLGRVLLVDYVHTFSRGLRKASEWVRSGCIGKVREITIRILKKGKLKYVDVYWTLASHALSILSQFRSLGSLSFGRVDRYVCGGLVYEGEIFFPQGKIHVSMRSPRKVCEVSVFGDRGFVKWSPQSATLLRSEQSERVLAFDEGNNLDFVIQSFLSCIEGERGLCDLNCSMSVEVTRVLSTLRETTLQRW